MATLTDNSGSVPSLETERLLLRAHRPSDFADCAAMWADPIVTRYIGGRPFTPEEVWSRLLRYAGHWAWMRFGYWAAEDKATGQFLGELGYADFKREMQPPLDGAPELGWVFQTSAHGRGVATEAVRAVTAWGDAHFGSARTVCLIAPENRASIRVAEKCGFRELHQATYKEQLVLVLAR